MIRVITSKAMIPYIVKGQRNKLTLDKNFSLKIDTEFFKAFVEKEVPYIHLCTINDFSKHMVIDPVNKSFIRYIEDSKSNYGWQINYNKFSFSYQLVNKIKNYIILLLILSLFNLIV